MKAKIPGALRQQVWLVHIGKRFEHKCLVKWCQNPITPFNFETGHNIPESKGGTLDIDNLRPICSNCNRSMGDQYTIDEFSELSKKTSKLWECFKFTQSTTDTPHPYGTRQARLPVSASPWAASSSNTYPS
jgi:hypothetical protein